MAAQEEKKKQALAGATGNGVGGNVSFATMHNLKQEMAVDQKEEANDARVVHAPAVVLAARTTKEEFEQVWEMTMSVSHLMPDEGIRRHHFLCLLVHLAKQRYRKKYTPGVCIRYMLTWEMCRGQIDYNPRKFRNDILYTSAITTVLSQHAHDLQSLFVSRATSVGDHDALRPDTGCSYLIFEQFRDMLRSRGLTDFAGVSEPHVRLAFIASQDCLVDEPHTHPPGLLLDEMCEAIVRIAYSMLLTAEERVARNKSRLKRVAKNRRKNGRKRSTQEKRDDALVGRVVEIDIGRVVNALESTLNIIMGHIRASDDPNHVSQGHL